MGIGKELLPILAVAMLTWGGVLAYMIRLTYMSVHLSQRLHELERDRDVLQEIATEREASR
jgi:hypothetical protein